MKMNRMMEGWNMGVLDNVSLHYSTPPILHHSNTPISRCLCGIRQPDIIRKVRRNP